jgi:hypothetical protein
LHDHAAGHGVKQRELFRGLSAAVIIQYELQASDDQDGVIELKDAEGSLSIFGTGFSSSTCTIGIEFPGFSSAAPCNSSAIDLLRTRSIFGERTVNLP